MPIRILYDLLALLLMGIACILMNNSVVKPFTRGFNLDDESIMYPYKKSTVSYNTVLIVCAIVPTIIIISAELFVYYCGEEWQRKDSLRITSSITIRRPVILCYHYMHLLFLGMATTNFTTDVPKMMIGRLRPHFLDVCKPNLSILNTTHGYITANVCRGDETKIEEARKSFPSGHTSMVTFSGLYIVLYMYFRLKPWQWFRPLHYLLSTGLLMLVTYVACSRISDYKHHWSDVLGGMILGTVVAIVTVLGYSDLFTPVPLNPGSDTELTETESQQIQNPGFDGPAAERPSTV